VVRRSPYYGIYDSKVTFTAEPHLDLVSWTADAHDVSQPQG